MRCAGVALTLALGLAMAAAPEALAGGKIRGGSPAEVALDHGLNAYKAGRVELAIRQFEVAAQGEGLVGVLGQFSLARVLADNSHKYTNHGRAYALFATIVDENTDIPDEDKRAPFVAKALFALASYTRTGVPEVGVPPNPQRAAQFFHQAATVYSDEESQFELAKLLLSGDGLDPDVKRAIHFFSILSQRGHPGAQAYLADILWRGKHAPRDQRRALVLITLALETAPSSERIWMEDIHQNVFCGTSDTLRSEATGAVADWRQKYGRAVDGQAGRLGAAAPTPRQCADGRKVPLVARAADASGETTSSLSAVAEPPAEPSTIPSARSPVFTPPSASSLAPLPDGAGMLGLRAKVP